MFNLLVSYTQEQHSIGIDEEGNEIIKMGVEYIDDIDLLKEMLDWKPGGNFDRITAFMHALAYARELDKDNIIPREERKTQNLNPKKQKLKLNAFSFRKGKVF